MKVYKVKVKYKGYDGYGYGTIERATRTYQFDSVEEAKSFVPTPMEKVAGHGVYSTLHPISTEIFEVETTTTKL